MKNINTPMTREEFDEFVSQHKLFWTDLKEFVRQINRTSSDLFDPETERVKEEYDGKTEWERRNLVLQKLLRRLHLLRVPLHYMATGELYIVEQECQHLLYPTEVEELIRVMNSWYEKQHYARTGSKAKKEANAQCDALVQMYQQKGYKLEVHGLAQQYYVPEGYDSRLSWIYGF